uniref:Endonuclease/exonuclease/phosphatase domain-containing protein n=1 Tax=Pseudonaja textilis TaxID=8673 RepID=A0A670YGN4_PSETE
MEEKKLITININGLNSAVKRRKTFHKLEKLKFDIIYLQEVHIKKQHEQLLIQPKLGKIFTSLTQCKKRGVEVLDYSEYEPHIMPSTKNPNQLFCKLTLCHLNKIPEHVLHHVQGQRYRKARVKPKGAFWEPPASDEGGSETDDSLSDLHPAELFPRKSATGKETLDKFISDSDEEPVRPGVENGSQVKMMEVDSQIVTKRRKKQVGPWKKKFKKWNRKSKKLRKNS